MSEARDRKMKRKRRFEEEKAIKVMRACRFRRFDENRWALLFFAPKKVYDIIEIINENVIELFFGADLERR